MRSAQLLLIGILLALGSSRAQDTTVVLRPVGARTAAPGDYVTLAFSVEGHGDLRFRVEAPEGWQPLRPEQNLNLEGQGTVYVSLRVPYGARAGLEANVGLTAWKADQMVAKSSGQVRIKAVHAAELNVPEQLFGEANEPLTYPIFVRNLGNERDTFALSTVDSAYEIVLSTRSVTLDPGETATVQVTVLPRGRVENGYRLLVYFNAVSQRDPSARVQARSETVYTDRRRQAQGENQRPQLSFSITLGLEGALRLEGDEAVGNLGYFVEPALRGDLSDFASGEAGLGPVRGDLQQPLADFGILRAAVRADQWNAYLNVGRDTASLGGQFRIQNWRIDTSGSLGWGEYLRYGASVSAWHETLPLRLRASTSGAQSPSGPLRRDGLEGTYQIPLGNGVNLELGGALNGSQSGSDYSVDFSVHERLSWSGPNFDLAQSYQGSLSGLHTLGLEGGWSGNNLAARAAASYSFSARGGVLAASSQIFGAPLSGLSLSVAGTYYASSYPDGVGFWSVQPNATWAFNLANNPVVLSGSYRYTGGLYGTPNAQDINLSAAAAVQNLTLSALGRYHSQDAAGSQPAESNLEAEAVAGYRFGTSYLEAAYRLYLRSQEALDPYSLHAFRLSWEQLWNSDLSSTLQYERTMGSLRSSDALGFSVGIRDLLIEGLNLNFGYTLARAGGFFGTSDAPLSHQFRARLGYTLTVPFDTPEGIVNLFGGRVGGELSGVAYRDINGNGKRDADEPPLPNLTIRLGRDETSTGANGRFQIRTSPGTYTLAFPKGLSAELDLQGESQVLIEENKTLQRDLGFAPVASVAVLVFNDLNRNGQRDADEPGVPYSGVSLNGPTARLQRTDSRGEVRVSGLKPGVYHLHIPPDYLPGGYRAPEQAVRLELEAGRAPRTVALPVSAIPREQVVTYSTGSISVVARATRSDLPLGADLEVEAFVAGAVTQVEMEGLGMKQALKLENGRWTTSLRLPKTAAPGRQTVRVTASGPQGTAGGEFTVNLVNGPLYYSSSSGLGTVGKDLEIRLFTYFRPSGLSLVFPDGQRLPLSSQDGRNWRTVWRPTAAGDITPTLVADGEPLGTLALKITGP